MTRTKVSRTIHAPLERVFQTVADIDNFAQAIPHITKVERLSNVKSGVGTRFRETRVMKGKETTTELEVSEYVENDRIRLLAESHGTVWDSLFEVGPVEGATELRLTMDAKAYRLLPRLINPLLKGAVRKALEQDMDAVKAYCEAGVRA